MNIKSLLLGSAAALIAVSGARAADAVVVAEPEPAEYVKICDVYGAGYFYIPGTETCLRIGGYIRYDIGVGDREGVQNVQDHLDGGTNDTYYKQARFALKTWTGQETELGTLKTYTETRFNYGNSSGDYTGVPTDVDNNPATPNVLVYPTGWQAGNKTVSLNFAWIQLGGLRVGKDESAFNTFSGYAGEVIDDTLVPYGNFDTNVIQYYFDAGNGFSAVVSLEEGAGTDTIDSYVPHVVGGVKWTQGWGGISGVVAYDSNYEAVSGKVRLDVTATNELTLWVMAGYGNKSDVGDPNSGHNFYKNWDGSWAVWGGGTYKFNEKTSFNVQASYDDGKTFGLAANVAYEAAPGFKVVAEVDYFNKASGDFRPVKDDGVGGILRFQRSF
ncbi:porin [Mesorhizobium erdmanii]|uniref:Porin n=2 Tax=Mesorhizobium TaxID=68287 RepID=A0A3M9XDV4_9HYPH|nr:MULTISPECIES: porin [Mesorhizobium]RNJ46124.1 porin [Mesorhizobium japonicum]RXT47430.1 porin [Mesorhizobium erdmanii]